MQASLRFTSRVALLLVLVGFCCTGLAEPLFKQVYLTTGSERVGAAAVVFKGRLVIALGCKTSPSSVWYSTMSSGK